VTNLMRGGAETQLGYLATDLARNGWDVHVGFFVDGPNRERMEPAGVVAHRLPSRVSDAARWEVGGTRDPLSPWRIYRLIRSLQPAIVQTWIPAMDLVGGGAALAAGVPWILSERSDPTMFPQLPKIRARAWLARRAAAVVSNSPGGDRYWKGQLGSRVPRHVVPNGVPIDEIRGTPPADLASLGVPADSPLVVYVGRLQRGKNIDILLSALQAVVREGGAVCVLCGQGPMEEEVERSIEARGLRSRVFRVGFVPDVWRWLRRADAFVSVSNYEGMPNSVMEAMAAGAPLVLSDIPAHRGVADEECARFVSGTDAAAVTAALLDCLRARGPARERVRRAAERAEAWSVAAMARSYADIYRAIGGASSGGPDQSRTSRR
jgi:glycosyltransferase involved in cell wall biosynthesis